MSVEQLHGRRERAGHEPLVIARIEGGFRVHSPRSPGNVYVVSEGEGGLVCSCPDFRFNERDPDWRCKHVLAVEDRIGAQTPPPEPGDYDTEERTAIEEGDGPPPPNVPGPSGESVSAMLLKRSVSPDGRIDSLSVEFSVPIDRIPGNEIMARAAKVLALQSEIVKRFLGGSSANGDRPQSGARLRHEAAADHELGNGAFPARMTTVGGMDTRYGRRLFINVLVNGKVLKLFGSPKQLGKAVSAAGYPDRARDIEEGLNLNLPCRATTKPSDDGRYVNIDRVLPPERRGREDGR